jgi:NAD(P)-dependent dehydrogenase (short-subunit alcohol dehydrogenase family)
MAMLDNKVVLVTGASSGLGRTAARIFAREGATVVVAARREAECVDTVDSIRENGHYG